LNKKILAAITAGFLTLALAQPASAATSGGSCTSAGAKTVIAKNTYVCAKNPFFNTSKLTWVWDGCIELNTDYQAGIKEAQTALRTSETNRFTQIEPVGADLRNLITWNALIPYVKNEVVYYNSNYFVATKASTNKAPTSANLGSTKFWVVSNPTNANSKIGQMPAPAQVITAANRQVAALTSASTKTSVAATKLKLNETASGLTTKLSALESTKASIQGVVDTIDPVLVELKSAVSLVTITRGLVKDKCNPKY
jgi:phosphate-selective porin